MAITAWSAKVCSDLDLARGKLSRLQTRHDEDALYPLISQERHAEQGARGIAERRQRHGEFVIFETIGNGFDLAGEQHPTGDRASPRRCRMVLEVLHQRLGLTGACAAPIAEDLAVANADQSAMGAAELDGG